MQTKYTHQVYGASGSTYPLPKSSIYPGQLWCIFMIGLLPRVAAYRFKFMYESNVFGLNKIMID